MRSKNYNIFKYKIIRVIRESLVSLVFKQKNLPQKMQEIKMGFNAKGALKINALKILIG